MQFLRRFAARAAWRKPRIRILSLDGGGARGVLPAAFLVSLEAELQRQANNDQLRLVECFDLIAGTSTGGILAGLLTAPDLSDPRRPRFSAAEVCQIFLNYVPQAFTNVRGKGGKGLLSGIFSEKYDGRSLAMLMRMVFGSTRLSKLVRPCLITAFEMTEHSAHFFCSHDYYDPGLRKKFGLLPEPVRKPDWLLRDVCLATAAAPVFFKPAQIRSLDSAEDEDDSIFLDGGLFANNPALCAYAEVRTKWAGNPAIKDMLIVSVGTGISQDKIQPGGYLTGWGGGVKLIELLTEAGTSAVHFGMKRIYGDALADSYFRVNWRLTQEHGLDEVEPESLNELFVAFTGREGPGETQAENWLDLGAEVAEHVNEDLHRRIRSMAGRLLAGKRVR